MIRYASIAGIVLLILYYFAYPPFGDQLISLTEGHFFIVDKIFVEIVALFVILYS